MSATPAKTPHPDAVDVVTESPVAAEASANVIDTFREVMAHVPAPVAIVTAHTESGDYGATVSAFCSLSMSPPMMLVALGNTSGTLAAMREAGCFALNLMGSDQVEICNRFARNGADKFAETDWHLDCGTPHIADVPGFIACRVTDIIEGGDHTVVFGEVIDAQHAPGESVLYYKRAYGVVTHLNPTSVEAISQSPTRPTHSH